MAPTSELYPPGKQTTDLPGTSLVPAAAVISAPLAYTNVAAVKKLVVGVGAERWTDARHEVTRVCGVSLGGEQPLAWAEVHRQP